MTQIATSFFKPSMYKPVYEQSELVSEWNDYVQEYKDKLWADSVNSGLTYNAADIEVQLFEDNRRALCVPVTYEIFEIWFKLGLHLYLDESTSDFFGKTLGALYEVSDKSDDIINRIKRGLSLGSTVENYNFLCSVKDKPELIDIFYNDKINKLMKTYIQYQANIELLDPVNIYMARYIYTPRTISAAANTDTLLGYTGRLKELTEKFPEFINALALIPEKRLEHLVSLLYISDKLDDLGYLENENTATSELLRHYLHTEFPVEYRQYQILQPLGVGVSELWLQLKHAHTMETCVCTDITF